MDDTRTEPLPTAHLAPTTDPRVVLQLYTRDRDVHPYGIADVQQLWDVARWWVAGKAAVGVLDLPGSPVPVVYAVAARDAAGTLDLLDALQAAGRLGDRYVITGPRGLSTRLAGARHVRWAKDYRKMVLLHRDRLPAVDPDVRALDRDDLPALEALYATDPAAGDFFHPGLLDTGLYLGILDGPEVVASAGIRVIDERNGVAAIGNVATAPSHRGRGFAQRVTATLCHRLLARVEVVGLNVAEDNLVARRVYERLGFVAVLPYEEAELALDGSERP